MDLKIVTKLSDYYLDFRKKQWIASFNEVMPIKMQKLMKEHIEKDIRNKDKYISFKEYENKIVLFIFAGKGSDCGENVVYCEMVVENSYLNSQLITNELEKIIQHCKNKFKFRKVYLNTYKKQQNLIKQFQKIGFEFGGHNYIGKVKDALKYYNKKKLSSHENLKVHVASNQHINDILKIEKISHTRDKTSRMRDISEKQKKAYLKLLKESIKNEIAFLLHKSDDLVGYLWIHKNNDNAVIGDIAVHPDYWGNGFANVLYNRAFHTMKNLGIEKYQGSSSTKNVMTLAEKLNRKIITSVYIHSI